jgi:hypothetical protein
MMKWSAFSCFLPGHSENVLLDRPALLSPSSANCQATWLWYFLHCAVSGLPSRAFYLVAHPQLSHDSSLSSKWPDSMLAYCHEKESA